MTASLCTDEELVVGRAEDRERIARDLHDTVVQRLFATGLSLETCVRLVRSDPTAAIDRIELVVDDLALTVKHIRTAIFGLEQSHGGEGHLRIQIMALVHEASGMLGFEPRLLMDGPIDTGVDRQVAADLTAVLREALSNVARHAHASRAEVEVLVAEGFCCLRVIDDGGGPPGPDAPRGNGVANMSARAAERGGRFELSSGPAGGTVVQWIVPAG
jgi:signal transduction histidine kinase